MILPTSFSCLPGSVTSTSHHSIFVFTFMVVTMSGVFAVVFFSLGYCLVVMSFRPFCLESSWLEVLWVRIPMALILMMAVPSTVFLFEAKGPRWPFTTFFVTGHQWYWEYEVVYPCPLLETAVGNSTSKYHSSILKNLASMFQAKSYTSVDLESLDGVGGETRLVTSGQHLLLPSLVPFRIVFSSSDVIHNYNVKSLGLSVDAVPGRLHQALMNIPATGLFLGFCSENCGAGHFSMACSAEVVSLEDWLGYFESYKVKPVPFFSGGVQQESSFFEAAPQEFSTVVEFEGEYSNVKISPRAYGSFSEADDSYLSLSSSSSLDDGLDYIDSKHCLETLSMEFMEWSNLFC